MIYSHIASWTCELNASAIASPRRCPDVLPWGMCRGTWGKGKLLGHARLMKDIRDSLGVQAQGSITDSAVLILMHHQGDGRTLLPS